MNDDATRGSVSESGDDSESAILRDLREREAQYRSIIDSVSADFPGHLGLRTMAERAVRLGGTLKIKSAVGRGTHLRATIPLRP